jgi:hypothetical protein
MAKQTSVPRLPDCGPKKRHILPNLHFFAPYRHDAGIFVVGDVLRLHGTHDVDEWRLRRVRSICCDVDDAVPGAPEAALDIVIHFWCWC